MAHLQTRLLSLALPLLLADMGPRCGGRNERPRPPESHQQLAPSGAPDAENGPSGVPAGADAGR